MNTLGDRLLARRGLEAEIAGLEREYTELVQKLGVPLLPPLERYSLKAQYVATRASLAIAKDRLARLMG